MTLVVGVAPESPGRAALHVAAMLARSGGEDLLLCAVVPSPWPPGLARVDAEYREHLEGSAREALEEAGAHVRRTSRPRRPCSTPARRRRA